MYAIPQPCLTSLQTAAEVIRSGASLTVAGPEALLDQLPAGRWIGGSTSYFTADDRGVKAADRVFVSPLPEAVEVRFACYDTHSLHDVVQDGPARGFTFVLLPSGSRALQRFAAESRFWPEIFAKPVVGWVAGVDLSAPGRPKAKVYLGTDHSKYDNALVAAHVTLPPGRAASIETVNIFERDPRAVIRFPKTAFDADDCTINSLPGRLIEHFDRCGNGDGTLPLIGDFTRASVNAAVHTIDRASGRVSFYAPVFPDIDYYLAKPVGDYQARFAAAVARFAGQPVMFSCNCILNYLYGGFEDRRTSSLAGPVTFGEIAYLVHNQTMVVLRVE